MLQCDESKRNSNVIGAECLEFSLCVELRTKWKLAFKIVQKNRTAVLERTDALLRETE